MMDKIIPMLGIGGIGCCLLALGSLFLGALTRSDLFGYAFVGSFALAFVLGIAVIIAIGIDIARS